MYIQTTFLSGVCKSAETRQSALEFFLAPKESPDHGNDAWRKLITLGSHLDCAEGVQACGNLAERSMRKLQGM